MSVVRTSRTVGHQTTGWSERLRAKPVLSALVTVGALTVIVRVISTARELLVARGFGVSDATDAFVLAYVVTAFLVTIVAGSLNSAFLPTYMRVRETRGAIAAQQLFSSTLLVAILLLAGVTALLALAIPVAVPLLGSGFSSSKLELTESLSYTLLPFVFLSGLTVMFGSVFNARGRFALPAVSPILIPVCVIVFLLLVGTSHSTYPIAIGFTVGSLLETVLLAIALWRSGVSLRPRWLGLDEDTRHVMRQYTPMVIGSLMMASTVIVDQAMAATLGAGSVSALGYGTRIVAVVLSIAAIAVGTATLPHFSALVARDDWSGLRQALRRYLTLIFAITVPAAVVLVIFSETITRLLYQRGAFDSSATRSVAAIQSMLAIQIPFFIGGILVVRVVSSLRANVILMYGAIISVLVNVGLNYAFMQWIGVKGIALSTSFVYIVSFSFALTFLRRRISAAERTDDVGMSESVSDEIAGFPVVEP